MVILGKKWANVSCKNSNLKLFQPDMVAYLWLEQRLLINRNYLESFKIQCLVLPDFV